jgi:hypothetical protein
MWCVLSVASPCKGVCRDAMTGAGGWMHHAVAASQAEKEKGCLPFARLLGAHTWVSMQHA